jgi:hypothetical protein
VDQCPAPAMYPPAAITSSSLLIATPSATAAHDSTSHLKLSVKRTSPFYLLETEDLFTHESQPGRTLGEWVGGVFEIDSSDWSNGLRYHNFDTKPDTEFKVSTLCGMRWPVGWIERQ